MLNHEHLLTTKQFWTHRRLRMGAARLLDYKTAKIANGRVIKGELLFKVMIFIRWSGMWKSESKCMSYVKGIREDQVCHSPTGPYLNGFLPPGTPDPLHYSPQRGRNIYNSTFVLLSFILCSCSLQFEFLHVSTTWQNDEIILDITRTVFVCVCASCAYA